MAAILASGGHLDHGSGVSFGLVQLGSFAWVVTRGRVTWNNDANANLSNLCYTCWLNRIRWSFLELQRNHSSFVERLLNSKYCPLPFISSLFLLIPSRNMVYKFLDDVSNDVTKPCRQYIVTSRYIVTSLYMFYMIFEVHIIVTPSTRAVGSCFEKNWVWFLIMFQNVSLFQVFHYHTFSLHL